MKILWLAWWFSVIATVIGATLYELSSKSTSSNLNLRSGESITFHLFRVFPDILRIELAFETKDWKKRPELGDYQQRKGQLKSTDLEFINPGEPIKLLVEGEGKKVIYEAQPTSGYNGTTLYRKLYPFVDDGNPQRFQWSPDVNLSYWLNNNFNTLTISVLETGGKILDEKVRLIIQPPVTFKFISKNYISLAWFLLWPIYILLLLWLGHVLRVMSKKNKIRKSNIEN